ncbi:uncharacterized protein LOC118437830 [Folsomia candida]|uniref:uncharacterized protein LOC118437830 n=1 Tax=Folsomia candida TaxID=158441 RepID=UPI0016055AB5|nr:uncharacterized protein LOC118437830 [Folsomia candida]
MPPSIANTLILECRTGWGDQDAELWVRLINGLVQGSVGLSVAAVIVTTIKRIFLYPAVMVELWIKTIERKLDHGLAGFRVAQVFQNLTNSVMRKPLNNLFVLLCIVCQVISLYVIITSWANISLGVFAFFYLMGFDFFIMIHVTLHSQSKSYVASLKFAENMKSLQSRNPWFRKFLKSCPPLKVGMGDGKFFDALSAFVIFQFCVDRLINLLLMEK